MDVTDATFETEVLARSGEVTVVVDLWANWCGPCRTLGPVLERVIEETDGDVVLAKVDIDSNPRVAATFSVQSIPAVFALKDRKVVDSFIGAQPEPAVRQFVDALRPIQSDAQRLIVAGDEASLRKAIELEPANERAILALATLLVDSAGGGEAGEAARKEALGFLARIPETAEVRRVAALARVGEEAAEPTDDLAARLDSLLDQVKGDAAARQEFLDLLVVLGPGDKRVAGYRKALASRLF